MEYIEMRLWNILAFPQSRHLLMGVWSLRDTENSDPSNIPQTGVLAQLLLLQSTISPHPHFVKVLINFGDSRKWEGHMGRRVGSPFSRPSGYRMAKSRIRSRL